MCPVHPDAPIVFARESYYLVFDPVNEPVQRFGETNSFIHFLQIEVHIHEHQVFAVQYEESIGSASNHGIKITGGSSDFVRDGFARKDAVPIELLPHSRCADAILNRGWLCKLP